MMFMLPYLSRVTSICETLRFSFVFTAIFLLVRLGMDHKKRRPKLPPGPRGLPIIGNMLQLGKNPHLAMTELSKKYGDIYKLTLGSRMVIVLNRLDAIKEALLRQPMDFVTRPHMHSATYVTDGHSVVFGCMPTDEHRRYRKLIIDALNTHALAKEKPTEGDANENGRTNKSSIIEEVVTEEVGNLAGRLVTISRKENDESEDESSSTESEHGNETESEKQGKMTDFFTEIGWTTSNILCTFLLGERYPQGHPHIKFILDNNNDFSKATATSAAVDMMPWFKYVFPGALKKFLAVTRKFEKFMEGHINKHLERFDQVYDWENRFKKPIEPTNVLDGLIVTSRNNKGNPSYTDRYTLNSIKDLMGAGFDTVSKSLCWLFVYASVFQDAQERIYQEIEKFTEEHKRPIRYADRRHFPYTNAFINEVLRHTSFTPFTIPHAVTRDNVRLLGYDMPRGTIVFINQYSVNHDPLMWNCPDHFRPERFLAANGSFKQDIADKVMLFGMGRRVCPGKTLARLEMFLYTTEVIRQCHLRMHPDHPGLPATEYGLTMRPETGKMIVNYR